jgi:hypothetical protein
MDEDPYDIAINQILEGADGDVRLALRTLLIQTSNWKLNASYLLHIGGAKQTLCNQATQR